MVEALMKNEIWFNKDMKPNEPMFAAPIMDDGELIAFITIREASLSQTSLYYQNQLFVISRLIGSLIVTAISYQNERQARNYVPGTTIYNTDTLKKRLELIKQMEESQISSYRSIIIDNDGKTLPELEAMIKPLIRPLDFLAQKDENSLDLIIANADDVGKAIVMKRLRNAGVVCDSGELLK